MSRYKKASTNETELAEIGGVKAILRPTRDERMNIIELFMEQQKEKTLDLGKARKLISDLLYNSLFLWEDKKRTDKKEPGAEETTPDDIDDYVVDHLFELWLEILNALDIVDRKKLEELQKQKAEEDAKASKEAKENPN